MDYRMTVDFQFDMVAAAGVAIESVMKAIHYWSQHEFHSYLVYFDRMMV